VHAPLNRRYVLGRIAVPHMRPTLQCYRSITVVCPSVCRSICLFVTLVSHAKTAKPIEMQFGLWAGMGPRNHVLYGGTYLHGSLQGVILMGKGRPVVKYSDILPRSVQKRLKWSRCRLGFGLGWAQGSGSRFPCEGATFTGKDMPGQWGMPNDTLPGRR